MTLEEITNGETPAYLTHTTYTGAYFAYCSDGSTIEICDAEPYGLTVDGFWTAFRDNGAEWLTLSPDNLTDSYQFHRIA